MELDTSATATRLPTKTATLRDVEADETSRATTSHAASETSRSMPLFEYRCRPCARDFELLIRAGDQAACPQCGTDAVEKLFSEAAVSVTNSGQSPLPLASACPPGDAPCSPTCCRL